jgi:uroporphyrinogen decarboxylase
MQPKQRVFAALRGQEPDRLPVLELGIDWQVMRGLGFRDYFRMVEQLDLDAVPVNQVLYLLGWRRWFSPLVREFRDAWGTGYRATGELLPFPNRFPLSALSDLDSYRPPRPEDDPLLRAVRLVARRCPDRAVLLCSRADFAASWYLCGLDRLLLSYLEAPEFALRLADLVAGYYERFLPLAVAAGAEVVVLTDDYAQKSGCLMSRDHFRRFVQPAFRRAVAAVKGAGAFCVKHSDGDIGGVADLLVEAGVDALGPLEPAAGMDLAEVKRRFGGRIAVVGNLDVDLLSRGSRREVELAVAGLIRAVSPGGGHILSSGNTLTSSVRPENYRAMLAAARRLGNYPIRPNEKGGPVMGPPVV